MRITKKFLTEIKRADKRTVVSIRLNDDLIDWVKKDAEKRDLKFVDWFNNMILAAITETNSKKDIMRCLSEQ